MPYRNFLPPTSVAAAGIFAPSACWPTTPKSQSRMKRLSSSTFATSWNMWSWKPTIARAGVSMLRDEVGGRATFFVDSLRNLRLSSEYEPIVNFRAEDGVISRLDKLVGFRDPLGAAAKQFLPRLRAGYLTENATAAESLARENPQYAFVTPDGTCYQGRMVTGGRADEAGPLGMKRELRTLDAEMMRLEVRMSEMQAEVERTAAEIRQ